MRNSTAQVLTGVYLVLLAQMVSEPLSADGVAPLDPAVARLAGFVTEVAEDYPDVRHISVAELKRDYASALLIDVRERDEFDVSHLPGAVHAPTAEAIDALRAEHPKRALVFYCTVGVRSAIAVRALHERTGESGSAVNLAGSIFAWANAGEPLVDATGPTADVHPYSPWWGLRYLASPLPNNDTTSNLVRPAQ